MCPTAQPLHGIARLRCASFLTSLHQPSPSPSSGCGYPCPSLPRGVASPHKSIAFVHKQKARHEDGLLAGLSVSLRLCVCGSGRDRRGRGQAAQGWRVREWSLWSLCMMVPNPSSPVTVMVQILEPGGAAKSSKKYPIWPGSGQSRFVASRTSTTRWFPPLRRQSSCRLCRMPAMYASLRNRMSIHLRVPLAHQNQHEKYSPSRLDRRIVKFIQWYWYPASSSARPAL